MEALSRLDAGRSLALNHPGVGGFRMEALNRPAFGRSLALCRPGAGGFRMAALNRPAFDRSSALCRRGVGGYRSLAYRQRRALADVRHHGAAHLWVGAGHPLGDAGLLCVPEPPQIAAYLSVFVLFYLPEVLRRVKRPPVMPYLPGPIGNLRQFRDGAVAACRHLLPGVGLAACRLHQRGAACVLKVDHPGPKAV